MTDNVDGRATNGPARQGDGPNPDTALDILTRMERDMVTELGKGGPAIVVEYASFKRYEDEGK